MSSQRSCTTKKINQNNKEKTISGLVSHEKTKLENLTFNGKLEGKRRKATEKKEKYLSDLTKRQMKKEATDSNKRYLGLLKMDSLMVTGA